MSETYAMTLDRSEYVQKRNQKIKKKETGSPQNPTQPPTNRRNPPFYPCPLCTAQETSPHRHSDPSSLANLGGLRHPLGIAVRVSRDLDLLAELADSHGLPARDALHLGKELVGGARGVHVGGDVGVVDGALLEDADAVVVGADGVVRVLERGGHLFVGVDLDAGLVEG